MGNFRRKIMSTEELARVLSRLRQNGKKIVHCHGTFDFVHRGHVHQFEQAKQLGDVLVVSVTADRFVFKGPGRPVFKEDFRVEMIAALELVDYVTLNDASTAVNLIKLFKPNVYVKGGGYADSKKDLNQKIGIEAQAVKSVGGRMHFTHEIPIHSTPLLRNYIDPYPPNTLAYLNKLREKYSPHAAEVYLNQLKNLKVLVVGEAIVDQYDYVQPMEMSPKGGVVATKLLDSELYAGGSAACANHIANFCSKVKLVTSLGAQNSHESFIRNSLAPNITPHFLIREGTGTITKVRQIDRTYFKKHAETYIFDDLPINPVEEKKLLRLLDDLADFDLVVVADFGHGLITKKIVDRLCRQARFLAVNTQANSANKGFHVITRYPKVDYVNIDTFEARLALRNRTDGYEYLAGELKKILKSQVVAITLGHQGSLIRGKGGTYLTPVLSRNIVDPTGAGSAYLSLTSLCVRAGLPLDLVGFIGNVSGALATSYVGNKTAISRNMLLAFVNSLLA